MRVVSRVVSVIIPLFVTTSGNDYHHNIAASISTTIKTNKDSQSSIVRTDKMMKAIVQNGFGPAEQVMSVSTEIPKPKLKNKDHVLVQVYATSVNTPDWASALGIPYALRPIFGGLFLQPKNRIMGSDVAGIVTEVGSNVSEFQVGDEVFGSTGDSLLGAFAEYALAPKNQLCKKPKSMSFVEAAASVMSGITAQSAICNAAASNDKQHILINGASGSIGTLAIQMAKSKGATVTAVCSGKNFELVESLGADHVIDYTKQDFTTLETKYDVILDNVMNRPLSETSKALKDPKTSFVIPNSIGTDLSEWWGAIPVFAFHKPSHYPTAECKVTPQTLQQLVDQVDNNQIKIVIDKIFPFEETPQAVAYMASHRAKGKVAIEIVKK